MVRDSLTKKNSTLRDEEQASIGVMEQSGCNGGGGLRTTTLLLAERTKRTQQTAARRKKENDPIKYLTSFRPSPPPSLAIAREPSMAIPMRPSFEIKNNSFMFVC
jgi:hypothetical protein